MSEKVYHLLNTLVNLVKAQKDTLRKGRYDDALILQTRRQDIIDKIQNLDDTGKNDHEGEDFSHKIRINIEKILSIDSEMRNFLKTELNSISHRLEAIQKAKTFCSNITYHQEGETLNISA